MESEAEYVKQALVAARLDLRDAEAAVGRLAEGSREHRLLAQVVERLTAEVERLTAGRLGG